jgi:hypothetical protein
MEHRRAVGSGVRDAGHDADVGGGGDVATWRLRRSGNVREAAVMADAALSAGRPLRRGGDLGEAAVSAKRRCPRGGRYGEVAMTAWPRLWRTRRL